MLQLWMLDKAINAYSDSDKVTFPHRQFACSLQYKTEHYSPAWTDGRIDKPEVQQVIQDLIQYQKPFVKKYLIILGLLLLAPFVGLIIFFVLLNNASDNDTDYSDTDFADTNPYEEENDYLFNLWIGFCIGLVVWLIILMVCVIFKEKVRREKMSERAHQINPSFAARGLRWEVHHSCCNCEQPSEIQLFKDYAIQPQPGIAPAYLSPQGSYPM